MNQYQRLVDNLTNLNLNNMAASIANYRQKVNDSQISFSEAILELTDKEIAYQQQESLNRRIKRPVSQSSNGSVILIINFSLWLIGSKSTSLRLCHFWIITRTLSLLAVPTWAKHTYPSDLVSKHAGKACEHYS